MQQRVAYGVYPTSIAPLALQRAFGGQPPHGGQLTLYHLVAQRWTVRWASGGLLEADQLCAYPFILWSSSVPTDFPLHWFWPPTADLMPRICLIQQHIASLKPSTTDWIVVAGLICANWRAHWRAAGCYKWPPCSPPCLLPPPRGRFCST